MAVFTYTLCKKHVTGPYIVPLVKIYSAIRFTYFVASWKYWELSSVHFLIMIHISFDKLKTYILHKSSIIPSPYCDTTVLHSWMTIPKAPIALLICVIMPLKMIANMIDNDYRTKIMNIRYFHITNTDYEESQNKSNTWCIKHCIYC